MPQGGVNILFEGANPAFGSSLPIGMAYLRHVRRRRKFFGVFYSKIAAVRRRRKIFGVSSQVHLSASIGPCGASRRSWPCHRLTTIPMCEDISRASCRDIRGPYGAGTNSIHTPNALCSHLQWHGTPRGSANLPRSRRGPSDNQKYS